MYKDRKILKKEQTSQELKVHYQTQLEQITNLKTQLEEVWHYILLNNGIYLSYVLYLMLS